MTLRTTAAGETRSAQCDRIFEALSTYRRRLVLYRLSDAEVPVALADLAREIARTVGDDGAAQDAKTVYLRLYHADVPKLVEAGLVTYDRETDAVALARTDEFTTCIGLARRRERLA